MKWSKNPIEKAPKKKLILVDVPSFGEWGMCVVKRVNDHFVTESGRIIKKEDIIRYSIITDLEEWEI